MADVIRSVNMTDFARRVREDAYAIKKAIEDGGAAPSTVASLSTIRRVLEHLQDSLVD